MFKTINSLILAFDLFYNTTMSLAIIITYPNKNYFISISCQRSRVAFFFYLSDSYVIDFFGVIWYNKV